MSSNANPIVNAALMASNVGSFTFIIRRTVHYIGKISRSPEDCYPRLFLNAMIIQPRKNGAPQLSCNNNFARAISHIIPNSLPKKQAILKEWLPISKDKNTWQEHIEIFFESCGTTDDDQNEYEDEDNENHLMNPEESPNESAPP
jgi:hypothetical protein